MLQGRYLIGRVLGEGGFGITYVGRDTRLGVKIAVKEYYPVGNATRNNQDSVTVTSSSRTTGTYERGKAKFMQEARTMGKLEKDPQIVSVRDFFEENNTAYIVMEYIEGTTLKELTSQRGGKIPAGEFFEMIEPLFGAVQHMHELGLIHRDISPDNLMLESGDIKLLDFGCAKDVTDISQVNQQTQTLILKHGYSPFEQYQMSSNQGPWTDVYALGASIYYCLTGNPPPRSTDRIIEDTIVPPHKLGVKITDRQEEALMRALAVKPADRFKSMNEFHSALYGEKVPAVVTEKQSKQASAIGVRRKKDKGSSKFDVTVRAKLFETPEAEKQPETPVITVEKPEEKLFVTDEIPQAKSQEVSVGDKPTEPEKEKKSGNNKKPVIIAIVAIVIVIALAVTGIVWAVVGSDGNKADSNRNDQNGNDVVETVSEEWFKIGDTIFGSYLNGASYDAESKTVSFGFSASIGWEFDEGIYLSQLTVNFSQKDLGLNLIVNYSDGTTLESGYNFNDSISIEPDAAKRISSIVLKSQDSNIAILSSVDYTLSDEQDTYITAIDNVNIRIGTMYMGSAVIGLNDSELLERFISAVSTESSFVKVTATSGDIILALQVSSGWVYAEKSSEVLNDDGTYTVYFDSADVVDVITEAEGDISGLVSVYIDSTTWEEEIYVTKIEVVDEIPETGTYTVLYSEEMTDSGILSFLQDYDFSDPELYLYIYCTVDEEYLGYGPCGLCSTDWVTLVGGSVDSQLALTSNEQTNADGYMAVQLSYIAEVFEDAGYDVSDGVILNWWAFIGDEPYANLTKVEVVRVTD